MSAKNQPLKIPAILRLRHTRAGIYSLSHISEKAACNELLIYRILEAMIVRCGDGSGVAILFHESETKTSACMHLRLISSREKVRGRRTWCNDPIEII